MLETIISSTTGESFTLANTLIILFASIILGLIISLVYIKNNEKDTYSNGFALSLVMLPVIISIIILLVGNNVARAFSLAGAFSIIRFRSAPGDPRDITYVFFTLAVGLACGMGFIGYAFIFTVILCLLTLILTKFNFANPKTSLSRLKITVPEDLNFEGVFEEILTKYTDSYKIETVKTRDFGSLFELHYILNLKKDVSQKELLDELRVRNGNLNISLTFAGIDNGSFSK